MPRRSALRITKRTVDVLCVADKDILFWDRDLPGFGVRVHATGRKVFVVQTRGPAGPKRVTLGLYGDFSADEARKQAAVVIDRIRQGEAPVPEPMAAKQADGPTVAGGIPGAVSSRDSGRRNCAHGPASGNNLPSASTAIRCLLPSGSTGSGSARRWFHNLRTSSTACASDTAFAGPTARSASAMTSASSSIPVVRTGVARARQSRPKRRLESRYVASRRRIASTRA